LHCDRASRFARAFLAKSFFERMPVHVHAALLDAVLLFGGVFLVWRALR
jgi:hypothetical protein